MAVYVPSPLSEIPSQLNLLLNANHAPDKYLRIGNGINKGCWFGFLEAVGMLTVYFYKTPPADPSFPVFYFKLFNRLLNFTFPTIFCFFRHGLMSRTQTHIFQLVSTSGGPL